MQFVCFASAVNSWKTKWQVLNFTAPMLLCAPSNASITFIKLHFSVTE